MEGKVPIFIDFGGTLVDTISITVEVFEEALGKKFAHDQIKKMYKDASRRRMSMYLFFKYPVNPIKLYLKRKKLKKLQIEKFLKIKKLVPKANETLREIKKLENVELVLVTQNPTMQDEEVANKILQNLFGDDIPFDYILAGEDKVELIATHYDTETIARSVFIGDLPNDVYVAKILSIPCFGVTWGYSEEEELNTPFIVDDFPDLLDLVKDHLEDLKEDSAKDLEIEEFEFDEDIVEIEKDYELIDE
ncbi:MAG: HAD family hydrolase [Candidatus Heimdallarchaeota archaeon]|nr:HAD family hydrolase [Candidatus Heimdallarchaeota archaeon]